MVLATVFVLLTAQWAFGAEWDEAQAAYEKEDFAAAYALFEQLAIQGEARAQFQLGVMHKSGPGAIQDDSTAVDWFRKAAEQGQADAQYLLAVMYLEGKGVTQDTVEAYALWTAAAAGGIQDAEEVKKQLDPYLTAPQLTRAEELSRKYLKQAAE